MKNKLMKIYLHFGLRKQLKKLSEECYELIEAMLDEDREHIKEEIADVQVLLNQFKEYHEIYDDEIVEMMEYKIDRTLDRIEEGYYE
jgi:NTP pyrophosphatase (non-canonical NTP hydrolase)